MAKVMGGVVLSDKLFVEYHKFRRGEAFDKLLLPKMFRFFTTEAPVTNIAQYHRTQIPLDIGLKKMLANNGLYQQSLEDLAENNSKLKVILCDNKSEYPYIDVSDVSEKFEMNLSISFSDAEPRTKAIEHLKSLCSKARKIVVYDKFFTSSFEDNVRLLGRIFPFRDLEIVMACGALTEGDISEIQNICPDWSMRITGHDGFHDRYLMIDDKIEVVLSSGLDHLSCPKGDLLYIVRQVIAQRM